MVRNNYKSIFFKKFLKGFSLLELLIVIAILALLMSIILPALKMVKEGSRRIICQSNLRNIAIGWQSYLLDSKGFFYKGINANVLYGGWDGITFIGEPRPLNPYLSLDLIVETEDSTKIFKCPSDKGGLIGKPLPLYTLYGTSYQTNNYLIGDRQGGLLPSIELMHEINKQIGTLNESLVDDPSSVLLIGDYSWWNDYRPKVPRIGQWHNKIHHHNLAYLDGHIEYVEIIKGLHVVPGNYTVLPTRRLRTLGLQVQEAEK